MEEYATYQCNLEKARQTAGQQDQGYVHGEKSGRNTHNDNMSMKKPC